VSLGGLHAQQEDTHPRREYARTNLGSISIARSASATAAAWSPRLMCAAARFEKKTALVGSRAIASV
jgi:hypothetical protein